MAYMRDIWWYLHILLCKYTHIYTAFTSTKTPYKYTMNTKKDLNSFFMQMRQSDTIECPFSPLGQTKTSRSQGTVLPIGNKMKAVIRMK